MVRPRAAAGEPGVDRRRPRRWSRARRFARRSGPTPTTAASSFRAAASSIRAATSRDWPRPPTGPARTSTRASGRRAIRRQADGRFVVETERGAILARDVFVATNGYTDGVAPSLRRRIIPIGSYIIASEPLPEELAHELSPKGRAFFDTKNYLFYWHITADRRMVFGGRASMLPTSIERTAAILHRGLLEVHPQLAGHRIDYAWGGNVGFTFDRMPHVGRTKDGVTYAMGCCGTGVALMTHLGTAVGEWLAGGEAPVLAGLKFPLVPAPYEGRPWFLPIVGEWYRLMDRRSSRSRRR